MQGTLLGVFLVGLGLIIYPREDPRIEELDNKITLDIHKHKETLLREGERLEHEVASMHQKKTEVEKEGPQFDLKNVHKEPSEAEVSIEPDTQGAEREERLLREGERLDQEVASIHPKMTEVEKEGPEFDLKNVHREPSEADVSIEPDTKGAEREERLLREGDRLDQEVASIHQKMTEVEKEGPEFDLKNVHKEPSEAEVPIEPDNQGAENDTFPLADDLTPINYNQSQVDKIYDKLPTEGHTGMLDLHTSQENEGKPEIDPKPPQKGLEEKTSGPHVNGQFKLNDDIPSPDNKDTASFLGPSMLSGLEIGEVSISEQEGSQLQLLTKTTEELHVDTPITDWDEDYLWYICNIFSFISMIRFFRTRLARNSQQKNKVGSSEDTNTRVNISGKVLVPDSKTLQHFHATCIRTLPNTNWTTGEFLKEFANDLLQAMRTTNYMKDMMIEDLKVVEVTDIYKIIVPFKPSKPYSFQCQFGSDLQNVRQDLQDCGQIKMVENVKSQNGCHCEKSNLGDDVLCLLHCENETGQEIIDVFNGPLCMKNTPFLSKTQVIKWFQSTIRKAWAQISHKYEFELNFCNLDAVGALVVRFRSGKKLHFNINPVVNFNTEAFFFASCISKDLPDTWWPLSLTILEDRFLKHLSGSLPQTSCHIQTLEIVLFLHRKQNALTGRSALKDSHFKTALVHLLLKTDPLQWHPDLMDSRLQELLAAMGESLRQRQLHHILIGNPLAQNYIELPAVVVYAKPVNLFHPLVVNDTLYTKTFNHFHEMLKNSPIVIQDYVPSQAHKSSMGCLSF